MRVCARTCVVDYYSAIKRIQYPGEHSIHQAGWQVGGWQPEQLGTGSALPPEDIVHCFTRRVLGLWGAGPREFPALSTASPARVRGCWAGAAFSGLTFSWSSWNAVCCNVTAEPASRAAGPCAELPNITAPGGAAGSAQSSPRVARESWGVRSSHRRAEETSPRRVSGT